MVLLSSQAQGQSLCNTLVSTVTSNTKHPTSGYWGLQSAVLDKQGNWFIADRYSNRIAKYSSGGTISTFATGFSQPVGIAMDSSGFLYVAEYGGRIQKISSTNAANVQTVHEGLPCGGAGILVDASGNIYVTHYEGVGISKITPDTVITKYTSIGKPTAIVLSSDSILYVTAVHSSIIYKIDTKIDSVYALPITTSFPNGLALDEANNILYFSDMGTNRIRRINLASNTVETVSGSSTGDYVDGRGNIAKFNAPTFMSLNSGKLYVADFSNDALRSIEFNVPVLGITSFSPTSGYEGDTITVRGSGLSGATKVSFGGVDAASFEVLSDTAIAAVVANGASGIVRVESPCGPFTKPNFTFIPPAPSGITFTPNIVTTGTVVTISGANFTGANLVRFGGTPAQSFTVVDDNTITAVVGNGSSGFVRVGTPYGTDSADGLVYVPAPTITAFTPTAGNEGAVVTITGTNFTDFTNYGVTRVHIGDVPATSLVYDSPTQISVTTGPGASGIVRVETLPGLVATKGTFCFGVPTGLTFTPTVATTGTVVTINGYHLSGSSAVRFGGTPAQSFSVVDDNTITAVVGNGSSGFVRLTNTCGTDSSDGFIYVPRPTITSFTPTSGGENSIVIITGTNFTDAAGNYTVSSVHIGDVPVNWFTVDSPTQITVTVGAGASGLVRVETLPGLVATRAGFCWGNPPQVAGFDPTSAQAGQTVTITGANFTGVTAVSFGGTAAQSFSVVDDNTITAVVAAAGSSGVLRVTGACTFGVAPGTFTFISNASAAYSGRTFRERRQNDGGIDTTQTISLTNAAWTASVADGAAFLSGTHFTTTNVPAGLTLVLTKLSATQARISFVGRATNHANTNDVTNARITFLNAALQAVAASAVTGLNNQNLTLDFNDPASATYTGTAFTESSLNNGSIQTTHAITLNGDTWTAGVANGSPLVAGTHYAITGVPAGLTAVLTKTSNTNVVISFTGNATAHSTADNASMTLTFVDAALTSGNAAAVLNLTPRTLTIGFLNPGSASYSGTVFPEAALNNGSITVTRAITLNGDTWTAGVANGSPLVAGTHYTITGVPAGLNAVLTKTSNTHVIISFTGNATAHTNANDASPVLTFLNAAVASGNAAAVAGLTPRTLTIDFNDPAAPPPSSPNILGFTPPVATTGTVVTITGFGFTGTQNVLFGGTPASSFTVVSDSVIRATVDNGSSGEVSVVKSNALATLPNFTFVPRPVISSFTPATGNAGDVVIINGSNFMGTALNGSTWTTSSVFFGGTPAASFMVISPTQIRATLGAGATGAVRVETLPGNVGVRNGFCYMAPVVTAFAPTSASTGTQVVITGRNFTGTTRVRFNGVNAASYTVVSDTEIRAFPAPNTPLTGSVSITNPNCTDDLATFTFIPAPVIYGFWLSGGTTGDTITIDGIHFAGATAVKFADTVAASFTVVSPTRIRAVVGSGKTGAVTVQGPGGFGSRSKFIYYAPGAGRPNPPMITDFTPTTGADGTVVTINGLNFQGADWFTTAVRIGDAPEGPKTAIIQSMTATRLVVRVNGGATGRIRVYTPAGVTTSTQTFTYLPEPTITGFTPTTGGAGTLVTITGTNFTGNGRPPLPYALVEPTPRALRWCRQQRFKQPSAQVRRAGSAW
jgi:sugar lactone lactonase YvrE